jgi:hypothetical protein
MSKICICNDGPWPDPYNFCPSCGNPMEIPSPSDATNCSAAGEAALGEAMQDVWNDRCQDIGEMPTCFEVHGPKTTRVVADFEGSAFVRDIVETLKARGYSILPNKEITGA